MAERPCAYLLASPFWLPAMTAIILHPLQRALSSIDDSVAFSDEKGQAQIRLTIVLTDQACQGARNMQEVRPLPLSHLSDVSDEDEVMEEKGSLRTETTSLQALYALAPRVLVQVVPLGRRPILYDLVQDHVASERVKVMMLSCGPAELCDASRDVARRCNFTYSEESFDW